MLCRGGAHRPAADPAKAPRGRPPAAYQAAPYFGAFAASPSCYFGARHFGGPFAFFGTRAAYFGAILARVYFGARGLFRYPEKIFPEGLAFSAVFRKYGARLGMDQAAISEGTEFMQSFTISGADLFAVVSKVAHVVDSRSRAPILQTVLFRIAGGALAITGTDLDRELTARASVTGEGAAEFLAPFLQLQKAAAAFKKADAVTLRFSEDDKGARLEIQAGARVYTVTALAGEYPERVDGVDENGKRGLIPTGAMLRRVDEFPLMSRLPVEPCASRFSISGVDFSNVLQAVAVAMSQEETRYYLNGVYFFGGGEYGPGVVATDGHRLELHSLARYWRSPENVDALGHIMPRCTVADLIKLARPADSVAVEFTQTKVIVSAPSWELVSKLIAGEFPNFARVIPRQDQAQARVRFSAADVVDFTKAADAYATSKARPMRFVVNGSFVADAKGEAGAVRDTIPADIWKGPAFDPGDELQIGFNSQYLADALRLMDQAEMYMTDAESPAVIRSPDLDGLRVLMPLRV